MEPLSKIVGKNMREKGLGESTFASILIARANKHVSDFLGTAGSKNIRVKSFNQDIITLEITSAAWAQEFQFCRTEFLDRIRIDFPEKKILDIKMRIIGREDIYDNIDYRYRTK